MQRYDAVNMAKGEYILFIEGDDTFSEKDILKKIYEKASSDQLDILEYKSYHLTIPSKNKIIYQPELFSVMYFGQDDFNKLNQFHLCGKLIQRKFFLNTFQEVKVSPLYFEQNIQKFDQSMILLILFRKAKTFEVIDIEATSKPCGKCEKDKSTPEIRDAVDLLLYSRFLLEYSDNHVPEKRMAVSVFIQNFLNQRIHFSQEENLKMLKEVIDLYLSCDKIGEQDIKTILEYKKSVMDKI